MISLCLYFSLMLSRAAVNYEGNSEKWNEFACIRSNCAADLFRGHLALTFLAPDCRKKIITSLTIAPLVFISKHKEREKLVCCTDSFNVIQLSISLPQKFFNVFFKSETKNSEKNTFRKISVRQEKSDHNRSHFSKPQLSINTFLFTTYN